MRFINRNAYIMTAIYGANFCSAAKDAFSLLMRNAARVLGLDALCDFVLLIGKLVVTGAVTGIAFLLVSGE